jgi:TonB family protein
MQVIFTLAVILPLLPGQQPIDIYRVGRGVTAPTVISKVDPEYSEAARIAKVQGTVVLEAVVAEDGVPKVLGVIRGLGYGLDENAVAAIERWRFKPGTKDGTPVKVSLNIEVNFNLDVGRLANTNGQPTLPGTQSRTPVTVIAMDSSSTDTIYAGTRTGVYKTIDGGANWRLSGSFESVATLAIDPRNSSILYAGSLSKGIFKSVDAGTTWRQLAQLPARAIQIDPNDSGTIYAATARGISKSIDSGNTWMELLPGTSFSKLTINPTFTNAVLAVTDAGDLFKSTDAGASWQFIGRNLVDETVHPLPVPSPSNRTITFSPSDPIDNSLLAPKLISPDDGAVFNVFPRVTTLRWLASPGATSYIVEWDYSYAGIWHIDDKKMPDFGFPVQGTEFSFDFVGAQPGRWRVWPVNAKDQRGNASEWRTFRYTR